MKITDLVFIGIKGSVIALDHATGDQVWRTNLVGSDFVNVVVQNATVFASCHGEVFRLDPLTGKVRWHNRLKGFGIGLTTIAVQGDLGNGNAPVLAEKRRCDDEAAAAATAATM